jgi:hypothetical protein
LSSEKFVKGEGKREKFVKGEGKREKGKGRREKGKVGELSKIRVGFHLQLGYSGTFHCSLFTSP